MCMCKTYTFHAKDLKKRNLVKCRENNKMLLIRLLRQITLKDACFKGRKNNEK